jgi:hypothetical protein
MDSLAKAGLSMKAVTDNLLEEGLQQFQTAFDALLQATGKASASDSNGRPGASVDLAVAAEDTAA